jgi:acetyl-CoA carboxylase alpha subunit
LGVTDRLFYQALGVFSVFGAEGVGAFLYGDASRAAEVSELLRLTSADLEALGIVDAVVPDDVDGVVGAVVDALGHADVGRRRERFDRVAHRWLTTST